MTQSPTQSVEDQTSDGEKIRFITRPIASWHLNLDDQFDEVTYERVFPFEISYTNTPLLDVAGTSTTDENGQVTFLVSTFVAGLIGFTLAEPVNVEATPRTSTPFFVTTTHAIIGVVAEDSDAQITVYAWTPDGKPAANLEFDWRCRCAVGPVLQ